MSNAPRFRNVERSGARFVDQPKVAEIDMLRAIGCIVVVLAVIGLMVVAGVFKMIF